MKSLSTAVLSLSLAALPLASAFHKGFNIAAQKPDGSCKAQADWENNFNVMKGLPGGFKDVRVYASSDCNTLQNAVPAAIATGVQILVGVWTEDEAHYNAEKQALLDAINAHGGAWISAVSVGSEDLYRGNTNANTLAQQIYDVRGMLSQFSSTKGIWVGHVDTWTAWVNPANAAVIKACDFVGMDAYPYFQGSTIEDAKATFYDALGQTQAAINQNKPGAHLWVTETSWPVAGPTYGGKSIPSAANARTYWTEVMCGIFPDYATYVYTLRDYNAAPAGPSFGVVGENFAPLYNLAC